MKLLTFAIAVAALIGLSVFSASNAADDMPPPRTGGAYDRPMFLRHGIDDLGLTLGQFAACAEETILQFVESGHRAPPTKDIRLVEYENQAILVIPGQRRDVYLEYAITPEFALLDRIEVANVEDSTFDAKWQMTVLLADACSSLGQ